MKDDLIRWIETGYLLEIGNLERKLDGWVWKLDRAALTSGEFHFPTFGGF